MSNLKGLFYPRTPTGKASIVPPVPWHYSGELITLEYRTDPAKVAAFQNAQNTLTLATRQLQEAYPELTSNANFMALQSQLEGTENRINISIKDYNEAVQAYNTRIRTFPDAIGAKVFYGSKPMVTYTATAPNADRAPTVDFN